MMQRLSLAISGAFIISLSGCADCASEPEQFCCHIKQNQQFAQLQIATL